MLMKKPTFYSIFISFSGRTLDKISDMLKQCCGDCGAFTMIDMVHMDLDDAGDADILFPVLARSSLKVNLFLLFFSFAKVGGNCPDSTLTLFLFYSIFHFILSSLCYPNIEERL